MRFLAILFLSLFIISCGKLEGEFAFKKDNNEFYKRNLKYYEFSKEDNVEWIFKFIGNTSSHKIGVILKKRELIWVDVQTRVENINAENNAIFGKFSHLEEGDYKIIILNLDKENRVIGERAFSVY